MFLFQSTIISLNYKLYTYYIIIFLKNITGIFEKIYVDISRCVVISQKKLTKTVIHLKLSRQHLISKRDACDRNRILIGVL